MVDSLKAKSGIAEAARAVAEAAARAAKAAAQAAAKAAAQAAAKKAAEEAARLGTKEGFDVTKKKPLSMTGRFAPVGRPPAGDAQLSDEVSKGRLFGVSTGKAVAMTPGPSGVNKTEDPKPSAAGKISQKEWDNPQLLLARLTQNPASGPDANSGERCGPSNVLGAALMQGPDAAAKYLTNVANAPKNNRLSAAEKTELKGIAERIKNKQATFEDLGRAQDLTYKAGNRVRDVDQSIQEALTPPASGKLSGSEQQELRRLAGSPWNDKATTDRVGELVSKATGHPSRVVKDPDAPGAFLMTVEGSRSAGDKSAYTDREVAELAEIGGTAISSEQMKDTETLKSIFKGLKPGESAIIRVSATADGDAPDHFVTIGRRKDGTAFIYNSDPSKGDSTVFVGGKGEKQSAAFMKELAKYEDRTGFDVNGKLPKVTRLKVD